MNKNFYFYTESAFIHQGDVEYLLKLVKASAEAGASGIKFQVIGEYDALLSTVNPNYESFKIAMISKQDWEKIFTYTKECGLDIIYMPCDEQAALFAKNEWRHFIKYIDIHPVNFIYQPIMEVIRQCNVDIILGVGGRTKDEIDDKISFFGAAIKVLMFGHQAFPTQLHQSAIAKIPLLAAAYPSIPIGYADHSPYGSPWSRQLHAVAYMLGARFFEKHIALTEGEERFDYITSTSSAAIKNMIADISELAAQDVEIVSLDTLSPSEKKYTARQLKAVAAREMKQGEKITISDIKYKMIESEAGFDCKEDITGKLLLASLAIDFPFTHENIQ